MYLKQNPTAAIDLNLLREKTKKKKKHERRFTENQNGVGVQVVNEFVHLGQHRLSIYQCIRLGSFRSRLNWEFRNSAASNVIRMKLVFDPCIVRDFDIFKTSTIVKIIDSVGN